MTSSAAVAARPGARFRLGRHPRRVALVVHLASAGGWLGIDIAMAVVIVTATTTGDAATRSSCLLVLELITVWPLLGCGLACLLSGLVLGLAASGACCGTGGSRSSWPSTSCSAP